MNKVFEGVSKTDIYRNCLFASIAHAVMVGKYPELTSEQSWDGNNYNFQDLEGGRGTISFNNDFFVAVVQNEIDYPKYDEDVLAAHFREADDRIVELAENEALQYVLDECGEKVLPVISSAFWGSEVIFSNNDEHYIVQNANHMLAPLICTFDIEKISSYWEQYYGMSAEQLLLVKSIFEKRQNCAEMTITEEEKELIFFWFDCIDDCIESFGEMRISFPK